jgi:hypothetical protein
LNSVPLRWLRLRHGWSVRWAHHPLCQRHAQETWRVGELFVCKGCVSMAVGVVGAALAVVTAGGDWVLWTLALLAPLTFGLSWPPLYHRLPRGSRNVLRIAGGASISLSAWVVGQWPWQAWPLVPALSLLWWWFRRARAREIAKRCDGCPELGGPTICSGYARQAACVRALETAIEGRIASRLVGIDGLPPVLDRLR